MSWTGSGYVRMGGGAVKMPLDGVSCLSNEMAKIAGTKTGDSNRLTNGYFDSSAFDLPRASWQYLSTAIDSHRHDGSVRLRSQQKSTFFKAEQFTITTARPFRKHNNRDTGCNPFFGSV